MTDSYAYRYGSAVAPDTGITEPEIPDLPVTLGLELHLDALDPTTITEVDDLITEWRDKSGNSRDFTQVTATNQMVVMLEINARQSVVCTNSEETFMTISTNISLSNATSICVFKNTDYSTQSDGVILAANDIPDIALRLDPNSGANGRLLSSDGQFQASHFLPSSLENIPIILRSEFDISIPQQRIFLDGIEVASNNYNGNIQMGEIGALFTSGDNCNGAIGEIIVYSRILSAAELILVEDYLTDKWGL